MEWVVCPVCGLEIKINLVLRHGELLEADLVIMQIPYVILEQYVQIGKKLQVIRKKGYSEVF